MSILFPPRAMIAVTDLIERGTRPMSSVKSLITLVGGSQIPNEATGAYGAMSTQPLFSCGSTEGGFISIGAWSSAPSDKPQGYVGFVVEDCSVKIIDPESNQQQANGADGEICVHGPCVFDGYCGNDKATEEAHVIDASGKRWFRTGDKGRLSEDNRLWVTGRYKEVFKVDTVEVSPAKVELTLIKHAAVKDAAIVATEDRHGERYHEVKAFVVREDNADVEAQELVDFVAGKLTVQKAPTGGVSFVDEIPRNPMKKVIARQLIDENRLPGSEDYLDAQTR
ncbi:putative AMP-dependent synthetase/ligase, AMP-binding enzyme domain, ANL domain-containing protein [Septoria linicola]|nr:putative AMP-dependent synthetase/ligase, AMP-binding enzyme domain, ANL domain-containing protein [Septoria linicola]